MEGQRWTLRYYPYLSQLTHIYLYLQYDGTHVDYGRRVFDLGDFHILDLETNMWLPCNLVNERFRGGCLGFTFYESKAEYANRKLPRKGWIFSGGLFSLPGWNVPEFRNDLCIIPLASYPKQNEGAKKE